MQPCIAVVNYDGVIQDNFFQGQGATVNIPYDFNDDIQHPGVYDLEQLDNGDLLVGGNFSQFMGETHYSVVKLTQGFVDVEEHNQEVALNLYPNPASDKLNISLQRV